MVFIMEGQRKKFDPEIQELVSRTIQLSKQEVGDLCEWQLATKLAIATNSSFLDRQATMDTYLHVAGCR